MLTRIATPFLMIAVLAGPAAADAVLVPGGSFTAATAISTGATMSASITMGAGVTAVPIAAPLRPNPYATSSVSVTPVAPAVPVAPPVIQIRRDERPAIRIPSRAPAPVVVPAAPTATVRIQPSAYVTVVRPAAPAPVVVTSVPTYAPPPVVVTSVPTYAPPPVVTVAPAPTYVTATAPSCGCCGCYDAPSAMVAAPAPDDDDVDLMLFGNYRYLTDGSQVGGASLALRLLLTDELSLEAGLGYLAGGTVDGFNREEVPTSLSLLWYVSGRDFPLYLGVGAIADWTNVWVDADTHGVDGNADLFRLGARAALGVEWQLLDTFVLTAEAETFVREAVDGATCDAGPGTPSCTEVGVAANLGFGLRF